MTLDEQKAALKELFDCDEVTLEQRDNEHRFELHNERWGSTIQLTYARMMQLPAILGTEHIDFGSPYRSDGWSEETGSFGGHHDLTIVARVEVA